MCNNTNQTNFESYYPTLDELLTMTGSTYILDCLWLYLNLPVGAIGVIFNLLAFTVFLNKDFNIPLYHYLRIYSINSCMVSLVNAFAFMANTPRLLGWLNGSEAHIFMAHVNLPVCSTCYFFGTILDVLVSLDRIATLKKQVEKWMSKWSPYKTSFVVFLCCLAANFAYFFEFQTFSLTANLNATYTVTIWYSSFTSFGASNPGKIVNAIILVLRDIIPILAEIIVNILSIYYLKEYMDKRVKLLNNNKTGGVLTTTNAVHPEGSLTRKATNVADRSTLNESALNSNTSKTRASDKVNTTEKATGGVSRADTKLSVMVVIMCALSLIERVTFITCVIYLYFSSDAVIFHMLYYLCYLAISIKHALNFFIFFAFNNKFRFICLKFLKF